MVIPGDPTPLARPRMSQRAIYDPQKQAKLYFGLFVRREMDLQKLAQLYGPLHLEVTFFMQMPKVNLRRAAQMMGAYHYHRPDLSNLIKFVEDALSTVVYRDDSLIATVTAAKVFSSDARTEFTLRELNGK
jgi:Holliday junction resolvase RusA-like endonuclease